MATTVYGNGTDHYPKFPKIYLDRTLADLLAEELGGNANEAVCNMKPSADPTVKAPPVNKKHLLTSLPAPNEDDLAHLQMESVPYLLSFWAGPLEIPMMTAEGWSDDPSLNQETVEHNAQIAFSVLNEKQRPRPRVFKNKQDFIQHYKDGDLPIRWSFAVDFAAEMPHFIHPSKHYLLNSKRWLAECPLRGANDRIIDPECSCSTHKTKDGVWYYGTDCSECNDAIEKEVSRLKEMLENAKVPFVLKITQSAGAVGTMISTNEEKRKKNIEKITGIQADVLTRVTEENASIHPVSLILSDLLPGETNTLNFFVRRNGDVEFLGAGEQLGTRETTGEAQHSGLIYSRQAELAQKFRATLDKIGRVLHTEGYWGPCGADIMEDESGAQYVIDLNVRTSTSTALACITTHCKDRGFDCSAVFETMLLTIPRDELHKHFEKEFREGRFIVLGTTRLSGGKKVWAYPAILAGEDLDAVHELHRRIQRFDASAKHEDTKEAGGT